jgi:hypothetical protein
MLLRYAYVKNNVTLWGPGSMYYVTLDNGDIWEIAAHTVMESEAVGVYIVDQVNKRDIDLRFEESYGPVYSLVNGRPIETWSYGFIPVARENMLLAVDEQSETIRKTITTPYAGQYAEYDEVYAEALQVQALPLSTTIQTGDYTYLDADIGVTISEITETVVGSVREAADLVVLKRNLWYTNGAIIRKLRLQTKKQINDCATDAEAYEICKRYLSNEIYYDYINP